LTRVDLVPRGYKSILSRACRRLRRHRALAVVILGPAVASARSERGGESKESSRSSSSSSSSRGNSITSSSSPRSTRKTRSSQSARSARGTRSIKARSPSSEPVARNTFEASPRDESAAAAEEQAYQIRCPMALLSYRSAPTYRVSPAHCVTRGAQV
jgi:hypothetical protein